MVYITRIEHFNAAHKLFNPQWSREKNEEVFVSISDAGKGISSQVLPRLFEKFVTDSDTGTGLGLYITRNLVEAHGGRIWAYNNNDGLGSTFVFSLPRFDDIIENK